jgi:hypothetical protein
MKDAVAYVEPISLLALTSKSSDFVTDKIALNNNSSVSIELNALISSGLSAVANVQGSNDGSSWFNIKAMQALISGDDNIYWTLSQLDAILYMRMSVSISSGSAIFNIIYRAT